MRERVSPTRLKLFNQRNARPRRSSKQGWNETALSGRTLEIDCDRERKRERERERERERDLRLQPFTRRHLRPFEITAWVGMNKADLVSMLEYTRELMEFESIDTKADKVETLRLVP